MRDFETIKALGLRPPAFISFSVFGYPDEKLALVVDISQELVLIHRHLTVVGTVVIWDQLKR